MATLQRYAPGGILDRDQANISEFPEAASQSFKAGDPVNLSSGKLQLAKAAGNDLAAGDDLLGFAEMDATGTTDSKIRVYVIKPGMKMRLPVYYTGNTALAVTAVASNGVSYGLRYHTGGILCVNLADTSATKVRQEKVSLSYPAGEQYGLVDVVFLTAETQLGGS